MKKYLLLLLPVLVLFTGCAKNNPVAPVAPGEAPQEMSAEAVTIQKIIFLRRNTLDRIYTINTNRTGLKVLKNLPLNSVTGLASSLASPDACFAQADGIYRFTKSAPAATLKLVSTANPSGLGVSPDGTKLLYTGSDGLYVCGIDGSNPRCLRTMALGFYGRAVWTPEGNVAYAQVVLQPMPPSGSAPAAALGFAPGWYPTRYVAVRQCSPEGTDLPSLLSVTLATTTSYMTFLLQDAGYNRVVVNDTGVVRIYNTTNATSQDLWIAPAPMGLLDYQNIAYANEAGVRCLTVPNTYANIYLASDVKAMSVVR
jgi:hypothetical protein